MRDYYDPAAPDYRLELTNERLPVDDESLCAPEPFSEGPVLPASELRGTRVAQGIMHCEDRGIPGRQREQTGVVVLVNVYHVRVPLAERSTYLEQLRNGRDRSHATGDGKHLNALALEAFHALVSLRVRPPELEGVGAAEHRNVVVALGQRARLLRSVLEEKVTDDQDPHGRSDRYRQSRIRRTPSDRPPAALAAASMT